VATVTFDPNITTRTTQPMAVVLTTGAGSDAGTATAQVQSIQIGDTVFPINQTLSVSGTSTAFPMGKATVGEVTMTFSPGDLIKVTLSYGSTNTWSGVSLAFKESTLPPVPAAPSGLTATAASATAINLNWLNNDTNATGYSILRLDPGQTRMQERGTVGTGVNAFNNTGLTTGSTYSYMIVARGPGGYSYSNVPTATVGNTFASWLTPPAAGFEPDSDGDGIPNGVENVLGTNPNTFSAGLIPVSSTATSVTFTHTLNPALASDVTYGYEWSSDLAEWKASGVANAGGTTATIEASTPTAGVVTVVATASGTPTATLFVRMVANNNP
jgi:hypothetical protein